MPLKVYRTPLVISPPADFVATRPELGRAAGELARAYADETKFVTDEGLAGIGAGLWAALVAAEPGLPARFAAARQAAGTRILPVIIASDEAAVQQLPWETLHHTDHGFLAREKAFTLSRRLPLLAASSDDPETGPLRVLMFTCLPDDIDAEKSRLNVEEQQALALQSLGGAIADGRVVLEMPDDGRFSTFEQLILNFDPQLVFLFTHGKFHKPLPHENWQAHATVLFEAEDGRSHSVTARDFAEVFTGSGVEAVVLVACETSMTSSNDLTAGLAWQLSYMGLAQVIGMRESILETAGLAFDRALAGALLGRERMDVALQQGRTAVAAFAGRSAEHNEFIRSQWSLPLLISPDPNRPLIEWDFTPQPPQPPTHSELDGIVLPPRFIGRRSELRDTKGPLLRGERRQLLITGPGGQGKTALAGKIARDWEAGGGALLAWSARPDSGESWDDFLLARKLQLDGPRREQYDRQAGQLPAEQAQYDLLLRLLLDQSGGRLLLFLDNLESLQDGETLALSDERVAAFVASARARAEANGNGGLRLLLTSRWRLPGWPARDQLDLGPSNYGDFLQMALAERAGAAFWHTDEHTNRPRRIYAALNGNGRGLQWFAAATRDLDPAAEDAFLAQLEATSAELREDMALTAVIEQLPGEARALLDRLPAYHTSVPREGVLKLGLDLPDAGAALDRLLDVSLVERYWDAGRQTRVYLLSPLVVAWLAGQEGDALDPAWLQTAAGYQYYLYTHEHYDDPRRELAQAVALHGALLRAGERAAADALALRAIVGPLQTAGLYRTLLDEWLPAICASDTPAIRARGLGHSGVNHSYLGEYGAALAYYEQSLAISQAIGDREGEGATLNNIAGIYRARGDYETALEYLQQSLAINQAIGDREGEGATFNNISQIYDARGEYETALEYLQQSLVIRQAIGDREGEGATLNNIAGIYDARGEYETALEYLQQSLAISQAIGDRAGEGATLNNIAQIYGARGDTETALAYLRPALAILQAIGNRAGEAATLNNVATVAYARDDYDIAQAYLQQSLAIHQAIGDRAGESTTLNSMAANAHARGEYEMAFEYLQQSLAISQAIGDRAGEGATLNNIAQIYDARGEYESALEYLKQALTIQQAIGDRQGEGVTLNNIAQIYGARGDYETALEYLQQSLAIQQAIGSRKGEGAVLNNLAANAQARGEFETALTYLQRALPIQQAIGDRAGEGSILHNIAQTYHVRGEYETALEYLQQSLAIRQAIGDRAGEGATLNSIGLNYTALGDLTKGLEYLQKSLTISQAIGDRAGEGVTLNNFGQIYYDRGEYEPALVYLQQALGIQRAIGDRAGEGTTLNNIGHIYYARGEYEPALADLQQAMAISQAIGDISVLCAALVTMGHIYAQNEQMQEAMEAWLTAYRLARPRGLAQVLQALEQLAPQLGLSGGLEGWEQLSQQVGGG